MPHLQIPELTQSDQRERRQRGIDCICQSYKPRGTATATVTFESDQNGAHEKCRANGIDGPIELVATKTVPKGKKLRDMPAEERKRVIDAVLHDVEIRKRKRLDSPSIVTKYTFKNNKIQYDGQM